MSSLVSVMVEPKIVTLKRVDVLAVRKTPQGPLVNYAPLATMVIRC